MNIAFLNQTSNTTLTEPQPNLNQTSTKPQLNLDWTSTESRPTSTEPQPNRKYDFLMKNADMTSIINFPW